MRFPNAWQLESENVFRVYLPDASSGLCAVGTYVFRLYNNRASANHRYTIDRRVQLRMMAGGWIAEGYGPIGVVMCSP